MSHSPNDSQPSPNSQSLEQFSQEQSPDDQHLGQNAASYSLLNSVWERQRVYSKNATMSQDRFLAVERVITILSVLVVVLAVTQPIALSQITLATGQSAPTDRLPLDLLFSRNKTQYPLLGTLNLLLIIIPIVMTALRAFAVKFSQGNRWVLLRGGAEALKMEIFYFRTQVQRYHTNRNAELAARVQQISQRLKGSVAQQRALFPYENQPSPKFRLGIFIWVGQLLWAWVTRLFNKLWEILFTYQEESASLPSEADRNADLGPDDYIKYRLESQFNWYRRRACSYDRHHQVLQTSVYIFGGFGTLLAAIGFQSWVAVTAVLAASFVNYLEYRRIEVTILGYNQAADTLYDIRTWWLSLSDAERSSFTNFEKLVVNTEETILSEHNTWLQDMQDRIANLYEPQTKPGEEEPEKPA